MTSEKRDLPTDSRLLHGVAVSIVSLALSACGSADTPQAASSAQTGGTESKPELTDEQLAQFDSDNVQGKASLGNNLAVAKTQWLDWSNRYTGVRWEGSSSAMIVPPPPRGKSQTIARMNWVRPLEPGSYYFHMHIPRHLNNTTRAGAVLFFNDGYGRVHKISANSSGYGGRWVYVHKRTKNFTIQLQSGWKATNTERVRVYLRKSR